MRKNKKTDQSTETQIALISLNIDKIQEDIAEIKKKLGAQYVTKLEFEPIQKVVYGLVALVLTAVVGALVGLVLIK